MVRMGLAGLSALAIALSSGAAVAVPTMASAAQMPNATARSATHAIGFEQAGLLTQPAQRTLPALAQPSQPQPAKSQPRQFQPGQAQPGQAEPGQPGGPLQPGYKGRPPRPGIRVVVFDCRGRARIRPHRFIIACADGNAYLAGLLWFNWGPATAFGYGVEWVNSCMPSCVGGRFRHHHAQVLLWRVRRVHGHHHDHGLYRFTRLTVGHVTYHL